MRHFRLLDDMSVPDRWFLNGPTDSRGQEVDPRTFTSGGYVEIVGGLTISLRQAGTPLDFTLADLGMPVVRREIGELLTRIAPTEVQMIPAKVETQSVSYAIVNVIPVVRCLDEEKSEVMVWGESDGRPDKVGQYRMVTDMKIAPDRVGATQIFRIDGWKIALIVSQRVRDALSGVKGAAFEEV